VIAVNVLICHSPFSPYNFLIYFLYSKTMLKLDILKLAIAKFQ
jgi:hypothetical protein